MTLSSWLKSPTMMVLSSGGWLDAPSSSSWSIRPIPRDTMSMPSFLTDSAAAWRINKKHLNSHTVCCGFPQETYIGISPYRTLAVALTAIYGSYVMCDMIVWENTNVIHISCNMGKYSTCPMKGVRLKAHTLFIGRVLYFPISHSNEHRLHIISKTETYITLRRLYLEV